MSAAALLRRRFGTLTHLAPSTSASVVSPLMVDVSAKPVSVRRARAEATLLVRAPVARWWPADAASEAALVATAVVAGVRAAKSVSSLIPLCHSLSLDGVRVDVSRPAPLATGGLAPACDGAGAAVRVTVDVSTAARTGVEMEALAGAAAAALTLYDMLKGAVDPAALEVASIRLLKKTGGARGDFERV
jgi:cyclic pyranopterin phosphate synthase